MSFKDRLLLDIRSYSKEYRWEELATELAIEIAELRPYMVFPYLYEKCSVRNKLDHTNASKAAGMLLDIGFYCSYFDPLLHSRDTFTNKVMGCVIEKYQLQKVRRSDLMRIVSMLLLNFDTSERNTLLKPLLFRLNDSVIVSQFATVLYYAVLYRAAVEELFRLMEQLQEHELRLTTELFRDFLESLHENTSAIKRLKIEMGEQAGNPDLSTTDVLQLLAEAALLAIFGC